MQPPPQLTRRNHASMQAIDKLVCERLGDTHQATNAQPWTWYRHIAMYLQHNAGWSLKQIGRHFERKCSPGSSRNVPYHHTTVLHAVEKIAEWRKVGPDVDSLLTQLEAEMKELPPAEIELRPPQPRPKPPLRVNLTDADCIAIAHEVAALLRSAAAQGGNAA